MVHNGCYMSDTLLSISRSKFQKKRKFYRIRILKNVTSEEALNTYRFSKKESGLNNLAFEAILMLSVDTDDLYNLLLLNYFSTDQKYLIWLKLQKS